MNLKVDIFVNFAVKSVLGEFDEKFEILLRRKSTADIDQTCTQYRTLFPLANKK